MISKLHRWESLNTVIYLHVNHCNSMHRCSVPTNGNNRANKHTSRQRPTIHVSVLLHRSALSLSLSRLRCIFQCKQPRFSHFCNFGVQSKLRFIDFFPHLPPSAAHYGYERGTLQCGHTCRSPYPNPSKRPRAEYRHHSNPFGCDIIPDSVQNHANWAGAQIAKFPSRSGKDAKNATRGIP